MAGGRGEGVGSGGGAAVGADFVGGDGGRGGGGVTDWIRRTHMMAEFACWAFGPFSAFPLEEFRVRIFGFY